MTSEARAVVLLAFVAQQVPLFAPVLDELTRRVKIAATLVDRFAAAP